VFAAEATAVRDRPLVRPVQVVVLDVVIEAGLLYEEVLGGRLDGLFLEREMRALVPSVLLRVTGLDAFDMDAQSPLRASGLRVISPVSSWKFCGSVRYSGLRRRKLIQFILTEFSLKRRPS
jgi:hypothetical protein